MESLTPDEARIFKSCVGKARYLNHHRPDIQHSVDTLSRSMRNPTTVAVRRFKKLTRDLLGRSEVSQELCPVPQAETLKVPVESDWADDRETRQLCRGGAVLFHGCAVLARARTKKTSSFERRGRVVRHWLRSNRSLGSSTIFARMAVQNSTASPDRRKERTCGAIEESLVA